MKSGPNRGSECGIRCSGSYCATHTRITDKKKPKEPEEEKEINTCSRCHRFGYAHCECSKKKSIKKQTGICSRCYNEFETNDCEDCYRSYRYCSNMCCD